MANFAEFMSALGPQARDSAYQFYGYGSGSYDPNNPYKNINPYAYSYMSPEDMPGDKLYADLIRAQTQDYMQRFAPIESFLAEQITATGTASLPGDLERTRSSVLNAGQNVQGQQARMRERFGVADNRESSGQNATVSALVGGLNDTRLRDQDRRMALLGGGLGALSQKARSFQA